MSFNGINIFAIVIKFIKEPSTANIPLRVGQQIKIHGCTLSSQVQLNPENIYWLKNGKEHISTNLSETTKLGNITFNETYFRVPIKIDYKYSELIYTTTNYTMQGYYQCAVYDPRYMSEEIKSTAVNIQFQGKHLY